MTPKELAGDLGLKLSMLNDALRGRSSIRDNHRANRMLLEKFGVRPETVWGIDDYYQTPTTIFKEMFSSIWMNAWRSTVQPLAPDEQAPAWLALNGLISERKERWWKDRHLAATEESLLKSMNHGAPFKKGLGAYNARALAAAKRDPILCAEGIEMFASYPAEAEPPSGRQIGVAIIRYGLQEYERFFPEKNRMDTSPELT